MLKKCNINLKENKSFAVTDKFGPDKSKKIKYRLNSLGFRGEEFNEKSKFKIFVAGCSHTFGLGINWEDTWGYKFKEIRRERKRYKLEDVCLMNFGVSGCSNNYIARNIINQCNITKPDILIILFTHKIRTEYLNKDEIAQIGIGHVNQNVQSAIDYYTYYTDEIGHANLLRNILLVQVFCKLKKIKYIFSVKDYEDINDKNILDNSACKDLYSLIDKKNICDFTLKKIDKAAEKIHCGPKSNKKFAMNLYKFYSKM